MTGDERLAKVAEALRGHQRGEWREVKAATKSTEARYGAFCTCGVMLDARDRDGSLRLHQADALAPLLDEFRAEVRAEMVGVLAGDETLVEAGARAFYEGFDSNPHHRRQWPAPKQHIPWWMARARDVISAVAAALAEEGGNKEQNAENAEVCGCPEQQYDLHLAAGCKWFPRTADRVRAEEGGDRG